MWGNWSVTPTKGLFPALAIVWAYLVLCALALALLNAVVSLTGPAFLAALVAVAVVFGMAFLRVFR